LLLQKVGAWALRQYILHCGRLLSPKTRQGWLLLLLCPTWSALGLEVKGGPQAAIHVKGHGLVLVDDPPGTPLPMQAHRCTHPETDRRSARLGSSAETVEAMAEGEVAAHNDAEIP
jgi:hypothetical protein